MEKAYLKYLDNYEIGLALNTLEKFFWNFCDNYLEIVKHRLYRPEEFGEKETFSAKKTVYYLLYKLLQNFSIYLPFVTEEIFKGIYNTNKSIHTSLIEKSPYNFNVIKEGDMLLEIISIVRGSKTNHNVSLKTEVSKLSLDLSDDLNQFLKEGLNDFKATLFIKELDINIINKDFEVKDIILDLE